MTEMNYIDIHTHTYYHDPEVTLVLNLFPGEKDKLELPALFSVGLHPWHVNELDWEKQVELVGTSARNKKVVAVGEAGLDKTVDNSYEIQQLAFQAQLAAAESLQKPLILHCVRSYSELLAFRKKSDLSLPWIFHWFNADEHIATELIRKNCYLSFGHMLFNEQSKAFRVFKTVNLERVFFETDDAGYSIQQVYEKAAAIRNTKTADLKTQILDNFGRCFQL
jgi:TatD DNase family protein